jgi:hypothetical protein
MSFADSQFLIVIKADRSSRAAHAHALFRAGRHRSSPPPLSRHAFSPASPDRFACLPRLAGCLRLKQVGRPEGCPLVAAAGVF